MYPFVVWYFISSAAPVACAYVGSPKRTAQFTPVDLELTFHGIKNGTTMYADDVANNQWSISVHPSLQSGVQLLLKRDGMYVRYQDTLPYVDAEVGIHCGSCRSLYGQVVRRQLFYTVLSRERGLPEWGLPPYVPFNSRFNGRSIVATE